MVNAKCFLVFLLLLGSLARAADRYETRAQHDPNGIGVFYLGREIAHVMGHQAAGWLERPERQEEERTDLLIDALKLQRRRDRRRYRRRHRLHLGEDGAPRGRARAGLCRGYPAGDDRAARAQAPAFAPHQCAARCSGRSPIPKLPPAGVDTIIMVDVYHEFDHPYEMTENMVAALKPGGRLVFVEFRGEDPKVQYQARCIR